MTTINKKYIFTEYKTCNKVSRFYIRCVDEPIGYLLSFKKLKLIVKKYQLQVLQSIHQNVSLELSKEKVIKEIISKSKHTKREIFETNKLKQKTKQSMKENQIHDLNEIFNLFQIPLIMPHFWKHYLDFISEPQLFEVIGKIFDKQSQGFYYLIKYKYFEDHSTFVWVEKSAYLWHTMLNNLKIFNNQNPLTLDFVIDKRYEKHRKQLIDDFQKKIKNKCSTVIGGAIIHSRKFYLVKERNQKFQNSQWKQGPIQFIFYKLFKKSKQDLEKQPFIRRKKIKTLILEELKKDKTTSKQILLVQEKNIEKKIDELEKLFIQKFHKMKREVDNYFNGVQIFDDSSDKVNIKSIIQKINLLKNSIQNFDKEEEIITKNPNSFEGQSGSNNSSDSESSGNDEIFLSDEQIELQTSLSNKQFEDQFTEKSFDFFQKVKEEYKKQDTESLYLESQKKKINNKKHQTLIQQNQSRRQRKIAKTQSKTEDLFFGSQINIKNQEVSTSADSSNLQIEDKILSEKLIQKSLFRDKVKRMQKYEIKSNNPNKMPNVLYRIEFEDGKVIHGSAFELIKSEAFSQKLVQNMFESMCEKLI